MAGKKASIYQKPQATTETHLSIISCSTKTLAKPLVSATIETALLSNEATIASAIGNAAIPANHITSRN